MNNLNEYVAVKNLKEGMIVDLEGDEFADPCNNNVLLQHLYQEVHDVVRETPNCLLVYFDFDAVGFPPDHEVFVRNSEPIANWCAQCGIEGHSDDDQHGELI